MVGNTLHYISRLVLGVLLGAEQSDVIRQSRLVCAGYGCLSDGGKQASPLNVQLNMIINTQG